MRRVLTLTEHKFAKGNFERRKKMGSEKYTIEELRSAIDDATREAKREDLETLFANHRINCIGIEAIRRHENISGTRRKRVIEPRSNTTMRVIQVIETSSTVGAGTNEDPLRVEFIYWSLDGEILAYN